MQGKHYTDVNHVATQMADKLGGRAFLIHAPLFADSVAEHDMLMGMKAVTDAFERARRAQVAVLGIGSILSADSSYYDLHPGSRAVHDYAHEGVALKFPCLRLEDIVIWGLTYRMFETLAERLAACIAATAQLAGIREDERP